jgi:hypothetical protein
MVVRQDLVPKVLGFLQPLMKFHPLFRAIVEGLQDSNDDIQSSAALIPATDLLVRDLACLSRF